MSDLHFFNPSSPAEVNQALEEFASRGALIIEQVFHRRLDVQQRWRAWVMDLAGEYENPALLLHEDVLTLVAQYLNVDLIAAA